MTEKIEVVRTINDDDLIRSFMRQQAEIVKETQKLGRLATEGRKVEKTFDKTAVAAKKAFEDTRTPLERYTRRVGDLKKMLRETDMTQDTYNRSIRQARQEYVRAGRAAQGFGKSTRAANQAAQREAARTQSQLQRSTAAIGQFVGALSGVGSATAAIMVVAKAVKSEYLKLLSLQKNAAAAQIDAGKAEEKLRLNFLADESVQTEKDLVARVRKIAEERNVPFTQVAMAATGALSAKGSMSNKQALSFVDESLRVSSDEGFVEASAQGLLDLAKASGVNDPRQLAGFARQAQVKSRTTSMEKFFENAPRVALTEKLLGGGSGEEGVELFSYLTNRSNDKSGQESRSSGIATIRSLAEFNPSRQYADAATGKRLRVSKNEVEQYRALKSTSQRIAFLQQHPNLAKQFLQTQSIGGDSTRGAITGLLTNDAQSVKEMADIRQAIKGPTHESQIPEFEKFVADRKKGTFAPAVSGERRRKAATERHRLRSQTALADASGAIDEVVENVDLPGYDPWASKALRVDLANRVRKGEDPREAGIQVLKTLQKRASDNLLGGFNESEARLVNEQIQILRDIRDEMRKRDREKQKNTKREPAGKNLGRT